MRYGITNCSLGLLLAGWSENGLCAVELADTEEQLLTLLRAHFPRHSFEPAGSEDSEMLNQISRFIDDSGNAPEFALAPEGTVFQQKVWIALQSIPGGKTVSYSELAQQIGMPEATRAVANACGANKLAVVIPCHRVIRADGGLGGYRWGSVRKKALLSREAKQAEILNTNPRRRHEHSG